MSQLLALPLYRLTDSNGIIIPNGRLYSFLTGTTTPTPTYTTDELDVSHGNYVQANSAGLLPPIYLDPLVSYRFQVRATPYDAAVSGMDFDPVTSLSGSALTYTAPGANSVARVVSDRLGESISVLDKHAQAGTGSAAYDTLAFQRAVSDAVDGSEIIVPSGYTFRPEQVSLNGKNLRFRFDGAHIICQGDASFTKSDHGYETVFSGGNWTGSCALETDCVSTDVHHRELVVEGGIYFTEDYSFKLVGLREHFFDRVFLMGDPTPDYWGGIYRRRSTNGVFTDCMGSNNKYFMNDDGDNSPNSAGLVMAGCVVLGAEYGVRSKGTDLVALAGMVTDYCANPIVFDSVEGVLMSDCYVSSSTTAPAMWAGTTGGAATIDLQVSGSSFIMTTASGDLSLGNSVELDGVVGGAFTLSIFNTYNKYGLLVNDASFLSIGASRFARRGTATAVSPRCIYEDPGSTGDSTTNMLLPGNKFMDPTFANAISLKAGWKLGGPQLGYTTRSKGQTFIPTGASSKVFAHGMPFTPDAQDVAFWADTAEAAGKGLYFVAADATNVEIGMGGAVAAADCYFHYDISRDVLV